MNFKTSFIYLILFLLACNKPDRDIINLSDGKIGIIGHGGIGFQSEQNQLPHNSFLSVIKAIDAYGAEGVEIDIQISKDHILMLYHDAELQSMTNCYGCVYSYSADELEKCRFRNDFYFNVFSEEYLIRLNNIIENFSSRAKKPLLFLDIKLLYECAELSSEQIEILLEALVKSIKHLVEKYNAYDWIKIQSTSEKFLIELQKLDPKLSLIIEGPEPENLILKANQSKFWGVIFKNDGVNKQHIDKAHALGLRVIIFDVKTRAGTVNAINKHPDYIQTDNILLLQQCLRD
jgi:glycerophosphoryl diester phosphodiesterase